MTKNRFSDITIVFSMIELVSVAILRQIGDTMFFYHPEVEIEENTS